MKLLTVLLLCCSLESWSQKLRIFPSINVAFGGICNCSSCEKKELKPAVEKLSFNPGIEVQYQRPKTTQTFIVQALPLAISFRLINKYLLPPNDTVLGIGFASDYAEISYCFVGYTIHFEKGRLYPFDKKKLMKIHGDFGLGLGINKSKQYYREELRTAISWADPYTYITYHYEPVKSGMGYFLRAGGGVDLISKRSGRQIFGFKAFFNQGLRSMTVFKLGYNYGFYNDPSKTVTKEGLLVKVKGTAWGFSIGVPITINK
jgi:hypothetical protein